MRDSILCDRSKLEVTRSGMLITSVNLFRNRKTIQVDGIFYNPDLPDYTSLNYMQYTGTLIQNPENPNNDAHLH